MKDESHPSIPLFSGFIEDKYSKPEPLNVTILASEEDPSNDRTSRYTPVLRNSNNAPQEPIFQIEPDELATLTPTASQDPPA